MILVTDATETRRDSYSRRNRRYHWEAEGAGGRAVEYERVQTVGPTPRIGYILATMEQTQIMPKFAGATKKVRDTRERSEKTVEKRKKREVRNHPDR